MVYYIKGFSKVDKNSTTKFVLIYSGKPRGVGGGVGGGEGGSKDSRKDWAELYGCMK